jgi:hypothetical protein
MAQTTSSSIDNFDKTYIGISEEQALYKSSGACTPHTGSTPLEALHHPLQQLPITDLVHSNPGEL